MVRVVVVWLLLAGSAAAKPSVVFTGNQHVLSPVLAVAARVDQWFDAGGVLDQEQLERGLLLVSAYYWDHGYAQVSVGSPAVTATTITIPIEEHDKFTLGAIAIHGDTDGSEAALVHSKAGDVFSRTQIANDREAIATHFEDLGYAWANVVPLTKIDLATKRIALDFEITRGKIGTIERIDVYDDGKLPDAKLRAALGFAAGDRFNSTALAKAKQRLAALGYADTAISMKTGTNDRLVIVTVELR
jgi:outer membrane protein insertion porin family